ncbi:MAG: hypothetical protein JRN06_02770 [Nitrososphaerota archaeon]|nr:hypothetical protein [Nitrososphaerota archaeon]MDG7023220.1 hypothetical protein [Nitrososphaerota archaeon]
MKKQTAIGLSTILTGVLIAVIALSTRVPLGTPSPCGSNPCTGSVYEPSFPYFVSGVVVTALGGGMSVLATRAPRTDSGTNLEENPSI